jgi:hypothetical protein
MLLQIALPDLLGTLVTCSDRVSNTKKKNVQQIA